MPLVSIADLLKKAREGGYAVPLFDVFEMSVSEDVIEALENKKAPAAVALYQSTFAKPSSHAFVAQLRAFAEKSPVPMSVMLDHGASVEQCKLAVDMGFTDVMYDGSTLELEENIANTRDVVETAHAAGVNVEAEIGHVGTGNTYQDYGAQRKGFTDPDTVKRFADESGVDFLAVAIGTAHGVYKGEPHIDIDLLKRIRERVDIPLVMHGGSGLSEEQFHSAIAAGIAKINVATDLYVRGGQVLKETAEEHGPSFFKIMGAMHTCIRERCEYYLDLFGVSGMG